MTACVSAGYIHTSKYTSTHSVKYAAVSEGCGAQAFPACREDKHHLSTKARVSLTSMKPQLHIQRVARSFYTDVTLPTLPLSVYLEYDAIPLVGSCEGIMHYPFPPEAHRSLVLCSIENWNASSGVNSPDVKSFLDLRKGGGTNVAKRLSESPGKGASWPGCNRDSSISGATTPPRCLRLPPRLPAGESTGSVLFLENVLADCWSCPSGSQSFALLTNQRAPATHKQI